MPSMLKLEEIIKLRSTPSNSINNVYNRSLTVLTGGFRCLHDDVCLYDLV